MNTLSTLKPIALLAPAFVNEYPCFSERLEYARTFDPVANVTSGHEVVAVVVLPVSKRRHVIPVQLQPDGLAASKYNRTERALAVEASVVLLSQLGMSKRNRWKPSASLRFNGTFVSNRLIVESGIATLDISIKDKCGALAGVAVAAEDFDVSVERDDGFSGRMLGSHNSHLHASGD